MTTLVLDASVIVKWIFPERPRDVERTGILIRLDADQRNKAKIAVNEKPVEERRQVYTGVHLVDRRYVDGDVRSEHLPLGAVSRNAV